MGIRLFAAAIMRLNGRMHERRRSTATHSKHT